MRGMRRGLFFNDESDDEDMPAYMGASNYTQIPQNKELSDKMTSSCNYYVILLCKINSCILSLSQILCSKSLPDSTYSRNTSSATRHYLMSGSSGHVVEIAHTFF